MLNRSKLTENVWFDDRYWKVVEVRSPEEDNNYLILQETNPPWYLESTVSIYCEWTSLCMINCEDDEFYPDTIEVRTVLKCKHDLERALAEFRWDGCGILTDAWLDLFEEEFNEETC